MFDKLKEGIKYNLQWQNKITNMFESKSMNFYYEWYVFYNILKLILYERELWISLIVNILSIIMATQIYVK